MAYMNIHIDFFILLLRLLERFEWNFGIGW